MEEFFNIFLARDNFIGALFGVAGMWLMVFLYLGSKKFVKRFF